MGVKLAKNAGFCSGVKRAMDIVLDIARHRENEQIYTYGPLIHNPPTIELLKKRGILPLEDICDIKEGTVIIRAHGISPLERKMLKGSGVEIIDATCPKVANVQATIKKHANQGYNILIVGDREHPEVEGLLGYAQGRGRVIGTEEDIPALPDTGKVCVVAQTTQSREEYLKIAEKISARYPGALVFDTICDSTELRQAEVKEMAAVMDAVVIVGGKNSANTRRLVEVVKRRGTTAFHVETAEELRCIDLSPFRKVGVSAGASTPSWIIEKVVSELNESRREKQGGWLHGLLNLWLLAVKNDLYSAVGAGCLLVAGSLLQGLRISPVDIAVAALYVLSMHRLNRITDKKIRGMEDSFSGEIYRRHRKAYVAVTVLSMVAALILAIFQGIVPFLVLLLITVGGMLYAVRIFPHSWRLERMKDLPGSKNVLTALAWAAVTALIPWVEQSGTFTVGAAMAFSFNFTLVFVKSIMSDMVNIQGDRLIGRETIPVLVGEERSRRLVAGLSVFLLVLVVSVQPLDWASSVSFALLPCVFYVWICVYLCDRRAKFSGAVMEGLLQTNFIVAGASTLFWVFAFSRA